MTPGTTVVVISELSSSRSRSVSIYSNNRHLLQPSEIASSNRQEHGSQRPALAHRNVLPQGRRERMVDERISAFFSDHLFRAFGVVCARQ